jgi:hypothetical protein
MEIILLASMEFADGALSEKRGFFLKSFLGFDPSRFDLFRHGVTCATVEWPPLLVIRLPIWTNAQAWADIG